MIENCQKEKLMHNVEGTCSSFFNKWVIILNILKVPTPNIEFVHVIEKMTNTLFDIQSEAHYFFITIYHI